MIVLRYLFLITLIGFGAWGLWHGINYIVGAIMESNKQKIRVRLAREEKENSLEKEEADLEIAEINQQTLYDKYNSNKKDAVIESIAITKSKLQKLAKKYNVEEKDLLYRLDGKVEWLCKHKVGHTIWHPKGSNGEHECDGCCKKFFKTKAKTKTKVKPKTKVKK